MYVCNACNHQGLQSLLRNESGDLVQVDSEREARAAMIYYYRDHMDIASMLERSNYQFQRMCMNITFCGEPYGIYSRKTWIANNAWAFDLGINGDNIGFAESNGGFYVWVDAFVALIGRPLPGLRNPHLVLYTPSIFCQRLKP